MRYAIFIAIVVSVNGPALAQSSRPSLTWRGEVTGGATLFIQGNRVDVQGRDTGSVDRPTYRFRDMLPAVNQTVQVRVAQGSGRVQVVEQPSQSNDYSAIVDIRNNGRPQLYSLEFFWKDDNDLISENRAARRQGRRADSSGYRGRADGQNEPNSGILSPGGLPTSGTYETYEGQGIRWTGRVDGTIRVTVRGNRVSSQRVSGGPIYDERTSIGTRLPRRNSGDVDVRKVSGRGDVEVIQRPDNNNNYTLMFEIRDDDGGSDSYDIEITWR
jgi:hypothetical protein